MRTVVLCLLLGVLFAAPAAVAAQPASPGVITDLELSSTVEVVRPDGSFIPVEERQSTFALSWTLPADAHSAHLEVERSVSPEPFGRAAVLDPGTTAWEETVTGWTGEVRCYRVRLTYDAGFGPWTEGVCTVPPIIDRPQPPGPQPAPLPPDTGQGTTAPARQGPVFVAAWALLAVAVLCGAIHTAGRRIR